MRRVDLTGFYATVSATGFTLLGLWWVVVDKHPEWFEDRVRARMAYVVSLQFMIPATSSLLSLVAPNTPAVWRLVFGVLGLTGIGAAALVARGAGSRTVSRVAVVVAMPVYVLVVLVAVVPALPKAIGSTGLQVEAFLTAAILLLGMHAVWFFSHAEEAEGTKPPAPRRGRSVQRQPGRGRDPRGLPGRQHAGGESGEQRDEQDQ
ncbi:MAG: hypothetical protein JWO46_2275 [Nocardioidaceae bacterium]|nr:hypothetical protein [Nocardioidaceae bacterium]